MEHEPYPRVGIFVNLDKIYTIDCARTHLDIIFEALKELQKLGTYPSWEAPLAELIEKIQAGRARWFKIVEQEPISYD